MSDMKLIMEGWRSYSQDKKENTIFLLEHNRPYKVNFDLILEQKRLDESIKLWEESSNYELEKLLSEIDLMGKAKELTSKIGMKINEFIFKMSMQAYKLIQKGAKAAKRVASIVSKLTNAISKYCSTQDLILTPDDKKAVVRFTTAFLLFPVLSGLVGGAWRARLGKGVSHGRRCFINRLL